MHGFSGTRAVERYMVKNCIYWFIDAGGPGRSTRRVIEEERTKCEDRLNAMTRRYRGKMPLSQDRTFLFSVCSLSLLVIFYLLTY